jgi:hypothetical protein
MTPIGDALTRVQMARCHMLLCTTSISASPHQTNDCLLILVPICNRMTTLLWCPLLVIVGHTREL